MRHRVIGPDDPKFGAIRRRIIVTWLKTLLGYAMMGALILAVLAVFGSSAHLKFGFGLLWILLPIPMWWFSADIAIKMQKAVPADPKNPDHQRLLRVVHNVWLKSGLKKEPPVYIAESELPNAFATGPIHSRAKVAATKGLFLIGATDEEIEAIFAHEFSHVKNYDVGVNSFLGILSSTFFLMVDNGVNAWLGTLKWFKKAAGIKPRVDKKAVPFLGSIIMYFVFWLTGKVTSVIQFFVVRSRESGADAMGALITGKPCDLATALEKLVKYIENHRPTKVKNPREYALLQAMRPIMTIDPLFDTLAPEAKSTSIWGKIKQFWKDLQLTHPPVPERVHQLEIMNGGPCPSIEARNQGCGCGDN